MVNDYNFNWSSPDVVYKALIKMINDGEAVRTHHKIPLPTGGFFEKVFYKVNPNPRYISWKFLPPELRAKERNDLITNYNNKKHERV